MSRTEQAWQNLTRSLGEGRLAHAYILEGDPRFAGRQFSLRLLRELFPDAESRVEAGSHPDILWVEPQSRSRQIVVNQVDRIITRLQEKSFEGGWKVVIISSAERMNPAVANKLLKTLEEPRGKTLMLLLTGNAEALLATIRSRCQIIALDPLVGDEPPWVSATLELLARGPADNPLAAAGQGGMLKALLDTLKKQLTATATEAIKESGQDLPKDVLEARVAAETKQAQHDILVTLQSWHRDLLLATLQVPPEQYHHQAHAERIHELGQETTYEDVMRRLKAVDSIALRLGRNMSAQAVLEVGLS